MIVPLRSEHEAACARLWASARAEMFTPGSMPRADGFAEHTAGEEIFVALTAAGVGGFVSLWRPEPFIHFLVVEKAERRRGLGNALLDFAVRRLGGTVELKCGIHNNAARAFYERRGWREVERIENDPNPHVRYRRDPD